MSDHETTDTDADGRGDGAEPTFEAAEYADGTVTHPPHTVGPNGAERVGTVDLSEREGRVVTWTTSTATPPGVREPNTLAIVEFEMGDGYDGPPVRALGPSAAKRGRPRTTTASSSTSRSATASSRCTRTNSASPAPASASPPVRTGTDSGSGRSSSPPAVPVSFRPVRPGTATRRSR